MSIYGLHMNELICRFVRGFRETFLCFLSGVEPDGFLARIMCRI